MLTGVTGPTEATEAGGGLGQPPRRTWRDHRGGRWLAVAAGVLLLFFCALREARQLAPQSDGAAMVLESWAMLHGDLLLRGWQLSDVSFYTTELPEYVLVDLVRGFHPDVVGICCALTFTLLVVLAAAVAYGSRPADDRTAVVRAGISVAVMVGPTTLAANVLLNDPDHTGTAVPILLALLILDRGRRRWWVPVAVAAVLGWALVGDSLVLLIGVAPLVVVCGARSFGLLWVRRETFSAAWYELSLTGAGVAAAIGGTALSELIKASGGFVLSASETKSTVPSTALPANLAATLNDFLGLFSADFFAAKLDDWLAVTAVHLVCACLVAGALFLALRAFGRDILGGDLVAQLLAVAIVINLFAYVVLYPGSGSTVREIAPVFALGGALAGRVLAEPLLRRRLEPLLALGAVAVVAAAVPPLVIAKAPPPASAGLALFLEDHDLTHGVAGYWNADSTTLDSQGRVVIVPVKYHHGHGLEPLLWEIQPRLFDSSDNDPNFLVATAPGGPSAVTPAEAVATFGRPAAEYHVGGDIVMVYRYNLLSRVPGWTFPGSS
jgi:hypothetical protein